MKILRVAICALGLLGTQASAASYSFYGDLAHDADVAFVSFSLSETSSVFLRTVSYAGGTLANGVEVDAGGFDPILTLLGDDIGAFITSNDDGTGVPADPITASAFDATVETTLEAGDYRVAISQYDNRWISAFGGSFVYEPVETTFTSIYGCSAGQFCDISGDSRTSKWAVDVVTTTATGPAPVPLPAGLPLLALGLAAFGVAARRTV